MTALHIEDGLVQWAVGGRAASADEALSALRTQPLLLLMHGYGSFEGDLIGLASRLPHTFVCASPRAPLAAPAPVVDGYAWWELAFDSNGIPIRDSGPSNFVNSGPYNAALALFDWLDALDVRLQDTHDAHLSTVIPMGFSQGGCMVTSLLRMQPERFPAGVNCSGFVAAGTFDGDAALAAIRPPMFWGRDPADPIIDAARIQLTQEWAPQHTQLTARLYDGIAHGIGLDELDDISAFLSDQLTQAATASSDSHSPVDTPAEGSAL